MGTHHFKQHGISKFNRLTKCSCSQYSKLVTFCLAIRMDFTGLFGLESFHSLVKISDDILHFKNHIFNWLNSRTTFKIRLPNFLHNRALQALLYQFPSPGLSVRNLCLFYYDIKMFPQLRFYSIRYYEGNSYHWEQPK